MIKEKKDLVKIFDLKEAKNCNTLIETGALSINDVENLLLSNSKYRQSVWALVYIATLTLLDNSAAVNFFIIEKKIKIHE